MFSCARYNRAYLFTSLFALLPGTLCIVCVSHEVLLIEINTPVWHMTGLVNGFALSSIPVSTISNGSMSFDTSAVGTLFGFHVRSPVCPSWPGLEGPRHVVRAHSF